MAERSKRYGQEINAVADAMELVSKLSALQATVEQYIINQDAINKHLAKLCESQMQALNGTVNSPGIITKVDRLEQKDKFRAYVSNTTLAVVIGIIVKWAMDFFVSHPPPH